jgi:hypothetical protein
MIAIAIVAFELGLGLFLHNEAQRAISDVIVPWAQTGVQLAFLNLLIGGPAWVFMRAIGRQNETTVRQTTKGGWD